MICAVRCSQLALFPQRELEQREAGKTPQSRARLATHSEKGPLKSPNGPFPSRGSPCCTGDIVMLAPGL